MSKPKEKISHQIGYLITVIVVGGIMIYFGGYGNYLSMKHPELTGREVFYHLVWLERIQ